ncbi:hypothetical protein H0H93_007356, partial [Arthromyces matolae]
MEMGSYCHTRKRSLRGSKPYLRPSKVNTLPTVNAGLAILSWKRRAKRDWEEPSGEKQPQIPTTSRTTSILRFKKKKNMKSNVIVVAVACAFATAVTAAPMYTPVSSRDLQSYEAFELQGRSPLLGDAKLSYPSLMPRADVPGSEPPTAIPMTTLSPAATPGGHASTPGQPAPHQQTSSNPAIDPAPQPSHPNTDLEAASANAVQCTCPPNLKKKHLAIAAGCLCMVGVTGSDPIRPHQAIGLANSWVFVPILPSSPMKFTSISLAIVVSVLASTGSAAPAGTAPVYSREILSYSDLKLQARAQLLRDLESAHGSSLNRRDPAAGHRDSDPNAPPPRYDHELTALPASASAAGSSTVAEHPYYTVPLPSNGQCPSGCQPCNHQSNHNQQHPSSSHPGGETSQAHHTQDHTGTQAGVVVEQYNHNHGQMATDPPPYKAANCGDAPVKECAAIAGCFIGVSGLIVGGV